MLTVERRARGATPGPAAGAVWSTMRPSRRNTTRSAQAASWASWVTTRPATPRSARLAEQSHHRLTVDGIEGTGRLVGQQEVPVADDGAGDGHPLPLAAGQIVGEAVGPIGQTELAPGRPTLLTRAVWSAMPSSSSGSETFSSGGQPGEQVEVLEHVADRAATQLARSFADIERERVPSIRTSPLVGTSRLPGDREQRALARTARAHDRHELAGGHRQRRPRAGRGPRWHPRRRTSTRSPRSSTGRHRPSTIRRARRTRVGNRGRWGTRRVWAERTLQPGVGRVEPSD